MLWRLRRRMKRQAKRTWVPKQPKARHKPPRPLPEPPSYASCTPEEDLQNELYDFELHKTKYLHQSWVMYDMQ